MEESHAAALSPVEGRPPRESPENLLGGRCVTPMHVRELEVLALG